MSLRKLQMRVKAYESRSSLRAHKKIVVFAGSNAENLNVASVIEEEQKLAKLQGSELTVVRVRWQS